jgi:hypothetical protein
MEKKRILFGFLLLLSLFANFTYAQQNVKVSEAVLTFDLPQGWEETLIRDSRKPPSMERTDPLLLRWKQTYIVDKAGRKVSPGLNVTVNVTVFYVPNDTKVAIASSSLMQRRGWPFLPLHPSDRAALKLPKSVGHLTEFSSREGIRLKAFVIHAINKGRFVEINLSAPQDIFPTKENEFRSIIQSLRLLK